MGSVASTLLGHRHHHRRRGHHGAAKSQKKGRRPKCRRKGYPNYLSMISEAIRSHRGRNGSSRQAISSFIEKKYKDKLPPRFRRHLSVQLRRAAKIGKVVKNGARYRLASIGLVSRKRSGHRKKSGKRHRRPGRHRRLRRTTRRRKRRR